MFARILAAAFVVLAAFAASSFAQDSTFLFRYKPGLAGAERPVDAGGFDVTARFVGLVGESFSSTVPPKPGTSVSSWSLRAGFLPQGLSFDASSGLISGIPSAEGAGTMLEFAGMGPGGGITTLASVRIDVVEPGPGAFRHDVYAHTGRAFSSSMPLPSGIWVRDWVPVIPLPDWATVSAGRLDGSPDLAGTYGYAYEGLDYNGQPVAYAYGEVLVEDGPSVAFVADMVRHAGEFMGVTPSVGASLGPIRWEVTGDPLPAGLSFDFRTGRVHGAVAAHEVRGLFRFKATDIDGTVGFSNEFVIGTHAAQVALDSAPNRYLTLHEPASFGFIPSGSVGEQSWSVAEGALPSGMDIDPVTGLVSGTPSETGTFEGVVIEVATAGSGSERSNPFFIRVYPDLFVSRAEPTHARVGEQFGTPAPRTSGGAAPYSYASAGGAEMPEGLSLDPATGVVSGSVQVPGNNSVTLVATDSTGRPGTPFTVGITGYGPVSASVPHEVYEGVRLSTLSPSVYGETADYTVMGTSTWTLDGPALPAGLEFRSVFASISGRPSVSGSFGPYRMEVTDSTGMSDSTGDFMIVIEDVPALEVIAGDVEVSRLISSAGRAATALNGVGEVRFELDASSAPLPEGLTLTEGGFFRGPSEATGKFPGIVVKAVDSEARDDVSEAFEITMVQPGAMSTPDVAVEWAAGLDFAWAAPEVSNTVDPVSFTSADMPSWLVLDPATGALSGNGPAGDHGPFAVEVRDRIDRTASYQVWVRLLPPMQPSISPSIPGQRLVPLDAMGPLAVNGVGKVTYEALSALPEGLQMNPSDGRIAGTPLREGTFPVSFRVSDSAGQSRVVSTEFLIGPRRPLDLSYQARDLEADSGSGLPLSPEQPMYAAGAVAYAIGIDSGKSLPPGVEFNADTGSFFGTPTKAGLFDGITVTATDAEGSSDTASVSLRVVPASGMSVQAPVERTMEAGTASVTAAVDVRNGTQPYVFSLTHPSAMPDGLVLNVADGSVSGTPSAAAVHPLTLSVKDALGQEAPFLLNLRVAAKPVFKVTMDSFDAVQGVAVSAAPSFSNGTGAVSWALSGGSLPDGLVFDPALGSVTGTTTAEPGGYGPYRIQGTDGVAAQDHADFVITVKAPEEGGPGGGDDEFSFERPDFAVAQGQAVPAAAATTSQGATETVAWSIGGGPLPGGLSFDYFSGSITGTVQDNVEVRTWGPYTVTAVHGDDEPKTADFSIEVTLGTFSIRLDTFSVAKAPSPGAGPLLSKPVTVKNAHGTVTMTLAPLPALPEGLSFNGSAVVGRTTADAGSYGLYRITAQDGLGRPASAAFTVNVTEEGLKVSFQSTDYTALTNADFSALGTASGAVGEVAWSLAPSSGPLPDGLALDPVLGEISGSPAVPGTWPGIVVRATDGAARTANSKPLSITVQANVSPILLVPAPVRTKIGHPFLAEAPAVDNEIGDYFFQSPQAAALGVVFDPLTGVMSGTFMTPGTRYVDMVVTDMSNRATSAPQEVDVWPLLQVSYPLRTYAMVNRSAEIVPQVQYALGSLSFTLKSGRLPQGLVLDASTGRISGTPIELGAFEGIVVEGTDSWGDVQSSNTFGVEVADDGSIPVVTAPSVPVLKVGNAMAQALPGIEFPKVGDVYTLNKSLPSGLTLDPTTGAISGTPASGEHGIHAGYVMTVADLNGKGTSSSPFGIRIRHEQNPAFADFTFKFVKGKSFSTPSVSVTRPQAIIGSARYSMSGGGGLSINLSTGSISGSLDAPRSVTVTVNDDIGQVGTLTATFEEKLYCDWNTAGNVVANNWIGIAEGNGTLVALSTDGAQRIATSTDGSSWTPRTASTASDWSSIAYGNGRFVVVGRNGTNRLMTSPDGRTWTLGTVPAGSWRSVTYGNGRFVAVAALGNNRVMYSDDGLVWTAAETAPVNSWTGVAWGNGRFVAVADGGTQRVMTSTDGVSWTLQNASGAQAWNKIVYGGGRFVAMNVGNGNSLAMSSVNGTSWTPVSDMGNSFKDIAYGTDEAGTPVFVAVGGSGLTSGDNRTAYSFDGQQWTVNAAVPSGWSAAAHFEGRFIAIGNGVPGNGTTVMAGICGPG